MKSLLEAGPVSSFFTLLNNVFVGEKDPKSISDAPYINKSIANESKNLIMTFPVLCDSTLPPSTAAMISKANERNVTSMLELLFASWNIKANNGIEALSKVHKNIKVGMSLDDVIDAIDNAVGESDMSAVDKAYINQQIKAIKEQVKLPQKTFPVNSFNEKSLNDFTVYNIHGKMVVREDVNDRYSNMTNDQLDQELNRQRAREIDNKIANNDIRNTRDARNDELQNSLNSIQRRLLDTDVKKANELQPTLMIVNYTQLDDKGNATDRIKPFVIGVKSRLIGCDNIDIVDRLIAKNKTKVNFLNIIRATTGEISLVKDLIFCVDQNKIDAKNSVKKGPAAMMWKVLEARGITNNANKRKKKAQHKNDATAITTLVISQETVNLMKQMYDFDLEKIANTKMIMEAYNLLGIVIADESLEIAKFFYDGNDMYEQQAYMSLEREGKYNTDKKINLMGRVNGGY